MSAAQHETMLNKQSFSFPLFLFLFKGKITNHSQMTTKIIHLKLSPQRLQCLQISLLIQPETRSSGAPLSLLETVPSSMTDLEEEGGDPADVSESCVGSSLGLGLPGAGADGQGQEQ